MKKGKGYAVMVLQDKMYSGTKEIRYEDLDPRLAGMILVFKRKKDARKAAGGDDSVVLHIGWGGTKK